MFALFSIGCQVSEKTHEQSKVIDCSPIAIRVENDALLNHVACGEIKPDGLIHLNNETMELIRFILDDENYKLYPHESFDWHPENLRCLPLGLSDGRIKSAYINDKGFGRFSDTPKMPSCGNFNLHTNLAQTHVGNNVAYFDKNFEVILKTDYPFIYGDVACSEIPQRTEGDHWKWFGGVCGRVDSNLNIIVPIKYPYETIPSSTE